MLKQVQQYIDRYALLRQGDKVLVAVSGGADSVALLDVLLRLGYPCVAAHCNFHLRGEESDRDETFVRQLCQERQIRLLVRQFDTQQYAQAKGISIEMAARELRYVWFEECRTKEKCQAIAVAHHRNDQAETLLLNLKRGTGLRGLCGMRPQNGYIVRPLLCVSREDILNYLTIKHLTHVEDSTNTDTAYRRNAIRAWLQTSSKTEIEHFADTCTRMQGYKQLTDAYINLLRPAIVSRQPDGICIDITALLACPAPETVLYELLQEYGFTQTDEIFRSLGGKAGKRFYSPTYTALKDRTSLLIFQSDSVEEPVPAVSVAIRRKNEAEIYPPQQAWHIIADRRIADRPLTIRHWKEGDWFIPIGMHGRKKVSDFLTDMKLPLTAKDKVWVICSGEDIAWIAGYRIDDRFKVTPHTREVAEIRIDITSHTDTTPSTPLSTNL